MNEEEQLQEELRKYRAALLEVRARQETDTRIICALLRRLGLEEVLIPVDEVINREPIGYNVKRNPDGSLRVTWSHGEGAQAMYEAAGATKQ